MTGVLKKGSIAATRESDEQRPGFGPRLRIVDCCGVVERVLTRAREALGEAQRLAVIAGVSRIASTVRSDRHLVGEVCRLDDERIAVPMPARIAHVHPYRRAGMRTTIERDDPALVNHLVAEDHV